MTTNNKNRQRKQSPTLAPLAVGSLTAFLLASFLSFLLLSLISPLFCLRSASNSSLDPASAPASPLERGTSPLSRLNLSSLLARRARRSEIDAAGGRGAIPPAPAAPAAAGTEAEVDDGPAVEFSADLLMPPGALAAGVVVARARIWSVVRLFAGSSWT